MKGTYTPTYMGKPMEPVPATIVGDLAIFKLGTAWQVHHVPTLSHAHKALPARLLAPNGTPRGPRREFVEWAAAWQAAVPAFFDMMRHPGTTNQDVHYTTETTKALAARAIAAGRAL